MKKIISLFLIIAMVLSMGTAVFADTSNNDNNNLLNQTNISGEIISRLEKAYGNNYSFDNFDWNFKPHQTVDGNEVLQVELTANMTLLSKAEKMPYYLGLNEALIESSSTLEKKAIQTLIDEYVTEVNSLYYNKPDRTSFMFEINNSNNTSSRSQSNDLYDVAYLCEGQSYSMDVLKINDKEAKENGKEAASKALESKYTKATRASNYDRLGARDYALNNFYDHAGEYSSNCANFVSYCLNEGGGLPQSSSWAPGYLNWIQTGFNGVNGVCIYMNNYENFAWTSNRSIINAGCIVFWNQQSHVGLTTYGDGSVIKFSAHTTDRQNITLPSSENVSFYKR